MDRDCPPTNRRPARPPTITREDAEKRIGALVLARAERLSRVGLVTSAVLVGAGVLVGHGDDDVELFVELAVDAAVVVEGHLDFVVAVLVADLGASDSALAGVVEGGLAARSSAVPVMGVSEASSSLVAATVPAAMMVRLFMAFLRCGRSFIVRFARVS